MMHTLAIVDTLTPGELTQGHVIAGTGTIAYDGTVGNIGGIRQKIVGAEAAGAEYVLVPEGNYEEALTAERQGDQNRPRGRRSRTPSISSKLSVLSSESATKHRGVSIFRV